MNEQKLVLYYRDRKLKGFMTPEQFDSYTGKVWWDSTREVSVSKALFDAELININNVESNIIVRR